MVRTLNTIVPSASTMVPAMFSRYRGSIEAELRSAMPAHLPELYDLLRYHMGWVDGAGALVRGSGTGGKGLRSTLCLFSCEACGGEWESALHAAAAVELVHNFSLIHDDIQDEDVERRHRPTVWALWGKPRALAAGCAMFSLSDVTLHRLKEAGVPYYIALEASRLLVEGSLEMIQGQCMDLHLERESRARLDDHLRMVALKTGALIRCSMAMGALLGSGKRGVSGTFARCGMYLGRAFQVQDDILGIWGDEAATGKAVGADIRRKKKSFPLVHALEHAGVPARDVLVEVLEKERIEDEDVGRALIVLEKVGAREAAHRLVMESCASAAREFLSVSPPDWAQLEFQELLDFLTSREY